MCDIAKNNLRLWMNELVLFVYQTHSGMLPPAPGTAFDTPPVPVVDRTLTFCRGGGEVLKIIAGVTHG